MKTRFNWLKRVGVMTVLFAAAGAQAASTHITATLDESRIGLGDSAQLTVTVSGDENAQPELPVVKGLQFTSAGQSSSFQSINGAVSSSVSFLYQVTADHAGTFTIPAIGLAAGGSSQPVTLQVLNAAGGASALPPSNLPPPNVQSGTSDDTGKASDQPAFLRVVLPKRQLYVGELMPVEIKAYFRAGMAAALNGLPTLSSDAFTINKLDDKPQQSQEMVGDHAFTVVTWSTSIAAVKSGDYTVNLELPVVVTVKDKARHRANPFKQMFGNAGLDDPAFDDSFFDDFFGGETEKPLTLRTDLNNVNVLPLPTVGRPADFSGAVGQFKITGDAAPAKLTQGDPITLHLVVTGQGNFDRVSSHGLQTSIDWKTYLPKAQFEPADTVGFGGSKTFEQAVIPLKSGKQNIPPISFSYFDANAKQYVTRTTAPLAIEVTPGSGVSPVVTGLPGNVASPVAPASAATPAAQDLSPNQVEAGNFVSTLRPVLFSPAFIALQGVPVMALATVLLVFRRRARLANDPERTRLRGARTAVRAQLQNMDLALAAKDTPAFFTAARQAIQEQLAGRWGLPASRVNVGEITSRLNGSADSLRNLFTTADDVVYSGQRIASDDLPRWRESVIRQLEDLESR